MGDGGRKHSPNDLYGTPTSTVQESTERILSSHVPINPAEAGYELKKQTHSQFIARVMLQGFPSKYVSQDASQPWLMFWILESFSILQVGLDPGNRQRSALHPAERANLTGRATGQSTRCLPVNIQMVDSAADRGSRRTFCRRMPLSVPWPLLGDQDRVGAGTKSIGMS